MNLTPEIEACIERAAESAANRTRAEIFSLLGVEDNEQGRKTLKAMGSFACLWSDVTTETRRQGIRGTVRGLFWLLKLLALGSIAYLVWKAGLIGGN